MQVLLETEVTPDQIDHLGHMNVMHYGANAQAGAQNLLADLGLVATPERAVIHRDTYVRHHREQLVGSPLVVRGGVLDADADRIRLYEELANTATGDIAATFVLTFGAANPSTRAPLAIDDEVVAAAQATTVELPDHGRSRSIALDDDPTAGAPTLAVVRERDVAERLPRVLDASSCDADGFVPTTQIAGLVWGGEPVPSHAFRPMESLPDGGPMGFATMETRSTWARPARVGDRIQSFGAELAIHDKTMLSRHWVYDVVTEELVAVFTVVSLAFDIAARRAVSIPHEVRLRMETRLHPDLVPNSQRPAPDPRQ